MSLYKVGESYFVLDGNHRVSVTRYQGVEMIDAEVTEFHARLPRSRRGEDDPMSYQRTEQREIGVRP